MPPFDFLADFLAVHVLRIPEPIEAAGLLLALAALAYLALALLAVGRFRPRRDAPAAAALPPATIMVPAHGVPPHLYECLRSICDQDYPQFQVVFGLHDEADPARAVIERVVAEFPGLDAAVVIDDRMIGACPKTCNLANMYPQVKHDVIAMVDADVRVERGFLAASVAPLAHPDVGATTCLYTAVAEPDFASILGALLINDWFVPSTLVSVLIRPLEVCYGAAITVKRVALERIGGFPAVVDAAAQDFVLGERLVQHGYEVRLADAVVETIVAESDLAAQVGHQLRWNRATRACRPVDHAFSLVTHPLPLLAAFLAASPSLIGAASLAAVLGARIALHVLVRRRFVVAGPIRPWLVPLEDCISFAVWVAAFFVQDVGWGGRRLRMIGPGRAASVEEKRA